MRLARLTLLLCFFIFCSLFYVSGCVWRPQQSAGRDIIINQTFQVTPPDIGKLVTAVNPVSAITGALIAPQKGN